MIRQFSAGGLVYKKENNQILWLIIKPKPSPQMPGQRYQFPKGVIEKNEDIQKAALREILEETGITAKIITKLTNTKYIFTFDNEKVFKIVTWYLMEYQFGTEKPDNFETEQVLWLEFNQAKKTLTYSSDKTVLNTAIKLVQ